MEGSLTNQIAAAFCSRTLPKAQWTHEAHLRVGLWHLLNHSAEEALRLMRQRIKTYNLATGGQNTDDAGYHETITRFFLRRIEHFLTTADCAAARRFGSRVDSMLGRPAGAAGVLLARAAYVGGGPP